MLCHISLLLLLKVFITLSAEVRVPKGSDLTLTCHHDEAPIMSEPKFKWTFRSKDSSSQNEAGHQKLLKKQQIKKHDEGVYECVTDGHVGESHVKISRTYNVSVDTSSSFEQWAVTTVLEQEVAHLHCSAPSNGSETHKDFWFKESGEPLRLLESVDTDNEDKVKDGKYWARVNGDSSIKIYGTKVEDAGMYYCRFSAGGENRTEVVELIVEALPPPRCHGHTAPWEGCEKAKSQTAGAVLSESLTDFATRLYSQFCKAKPTDNILFSPFSIAGVLSHLLLGARAETRTLIEDALCLPHGFSCTHKALMTLREATQESLEMASSIFYSPDLVLGESFINQSLEFYGASPAMLSSDSEQNAKMINDWVAEKTKSKISEFVKSVDSFNQLMLVNAVYFIGKWKLKFDESSFASFIKLNGEMVNVPTLYAAKYKLSMQFVRSLQAQVAVFPLTGNNRLFIIVPATHSLTDLLAVEKKMTDTVLRDMVNVMAKNVPVIAEVTIPKLKLDFNLDMNRLFGNIGLGELFNEPNLCGLFPEEMDMAIALSDARHRASLVLSESGVEAAAATSISFARSFSSFSAMQPFILVLWSDQANCPLFMGRVTQP